ncbi:MAG: hypothetical protein WCB76_15700, partial [Acidobacteriaceae bacterium]
IEHPWVIVLALAHSYERLREVPSDETNGIGVCDVGDQYARGTRSSYNLTNWIRSQGYHADPYPGPMAGALLLIPPAIAAGLGELGKHGSLISPRNFQLLPPDQRAALQGCNQTLCDAEAKIGGWTAKAIRCKHLERVSRT